MRELKLYRHPIVWGSCLIGALVALMAPEDVMQRHEWLRAWYEWLARTIPSVSSFARYSEFPEVTAAYVAVMWALAIPVGLLVLPQGNLLLRDDKVPERFGGPRRYLIFGTLFFGSLFIGSLLLPLGEPWKTLPIESSRLALAILGPIFIFMPIGLLATVIGIWKVYGKNSSREKKYVME